jgi:hypothetical protein
LNSPVLNLQVKQHQSAIVAGISASLGAPVRHIRNPAIRSQCSVVTDVLFLWIALGLSMSAVPLSNRANTA